MDYITVFGDSYLICLARIGGNLMFLANLAVVMNRPRKRKLERSVVPPGNQVMRRPPTKSRALCIYIYTHRISFAVTLVHDVFSRHNERTLRFGTTSVRGIKVAALYSMAPARERITGLRYPECRCRRRDQFS